MSESRRRSITILFLIVAVECSAFKLLEIGNERQCDRTKNLILWAQTTFSFNVNYILNNYNRTTLWASERIEHIDLGMGSISRLTNARLLRANSMNLCCSTVYRGFVDKFVNFSVNTIWMSDTCTDQLTHFTHTKLRDNQARGFHEIEYGHWRTRTGFVWNYKK